jgi:hypothetical protein
VAISYSSENPETVKRDLPELERNCRDASFVNEDCSQQKDIAIGAKRNPLPVLT